MCIVSESELTTDKRNCNCKPNFSNFYFSISLSSLPFTFGRPSPLFHSPALLFSGQIAVIDRWGDRSSLLPRVTGFEDFGNLWFSYFLLLTVTHSLSGLCHWPTAPRL
ncbi:Hypothetical predicted protein [Olea europaea subsp. europaea]|uniref:Uncharacterized protein n=1 Tax=Olea europaea subsp. europaea TaxID=158383 RepID=A0A8S0SIY9_OLEEU|nr:Hypothetical predicted protein [Olea europaea subsp. europaea]